MVRKRVIIGQSEWGIHDSDVDSVTDLIQEAMLERKTVALPLIDGSNRQVTVYLNGGVALSVVVDVDLGPKPTEIPG